MSGFTASPLPALAFPVVLATTREKILGGAEIGQKLLRLEHATELRKKFFCAGTRSIASAKEGSRSKS